jgi:hypothetical protein
MKEIKNPLILAFAIIGMCAVLYGAWHLYQQHLTEERARNFFAAPASSGIPDVLHASPSAPPPQ